MAAKSCRHTLDSQTCRMQSACRNTLLHPSKWVVLTHSAQCMQFNESLHLYTAQEETPLLSVCRFELMLADGLMHEVVAPRVLPESMLVPYRSPEFGKSRSWFPATSMTGACVASTSNWSMNTSHIVCSPLQLKDINMETAL